MQLGAVVVAGRPELGDAAAWRGRCWAPLNRGGDEARRGYGCGCCSGAVPKLHTSPSLSLQIFADRWAERMREAVLIPLVVLSPSPSHTSSPRPPQITAPLSLLPNPPLPLSMALLNLPIHPPLPSLPFPSAISSCPPFPVPSSFPVSLALSPPLHPLSLFPSLSLAIPVTSPNPFVFPSRGRESKCSGRVRGWEEWEGETKRDKDSVAMRHQLLPQDAVRLFVRHLRLKKPKQ